MFWIVAELSHVIQNLFDKIIKLLAVDIVFKSKLRVVLKYFLEDLVWRLLVDAFPVADKFDVLFGLLVVNNIGLVLSSLWRNYNFNGFLNPPLIE